MVLMTYLILMTTSTMMLYLSTTPIMLGINILTMALLLSATLATSMSSWYAFLVFLIYVGGMLVMFAYFLALTPNQQMPTTSNAIYMFMTLITLTTVVLITKTKVFIPSEVYQDNMYLYSTSTATILIVLALILLLTMLIVVKLTNRSKGPLRPFNYV
nr:NADH dehydrogenase subunit 6 [Amynthas sp. FJ201004-02]QED22483.1 NADH dehydrogenase subunit 6 [Amynthas sp. HN201007-02]QED22492.1 NADH dehydrogenase subunit 6 [Amynthas sp. SC201007-03]QED22511.1 NADH dehydrogenase subunit 6 [Amynthas sp. CQ201306-03]QED22512.1 NADH dehydrogenase subunit 6 [Amynthas sp. SC201008-06]QED22513.1 NADH dehydrogenase subunit 6 [Amynthas sp. YN201101-26]QED22519.1 NADH dehydrogenase subunit 6 [Amynthas sp. ZJ201512-05]QED22524.1 NADH dehydrogenase subunit 6 [A